MGEATIDQGVSFRPPAPTPRAARAGPITLIRALWNSPIEAWTQAHFEEPVVSHGLPFGKALIVNDPAGIEHVLLRNAANYRKDTLQRRIIAGGLSNGLLTAENEQWRFQRRTLAPMFSLRTIRGFSAPMRQVADEYVARWRALAAGESVDMAAEMTRLTLEVLERTIFSDGLGHSIEEFRGAMRSYFDTIGRIDPFDLLGLPDAIPRLTRLQARGALRFFDTAVDTIIANRGRRLAEEPQAVARDILTLLLEARDPQTGSGLSEVEIKANIITFIAAGHETTANALAWSLFLLSQSPAWSERVAAEAERELAGPIDAAADSMVATRAVIEEAMRLYPPLAAISREAIGPDEIAGHPVAAGCTVVIAPYVLHRHRGLWERPDLFDPSRFLPDAREQIGRYAYLPFGAGPRICIGAAFALQEATLVLGTILRHFRVALAPGTRVWPLQRLTLRPRGGLPMVLARRESGLACAAPDGAVAKAEVPQP
ncbi:MAG TPA: cytochrome P450 [Xanthobacteraceae bacterium]|nr:cytochrome P450 [Xanthobacteraceae bacterium]